MSVAHITTKLFRLKPYKFTVCRTHRKETMMRRYGIVTGSVKQFFASYFTDEAWFCVNVDTQNNRYWTMDNARRGTVLRI